MWICGIVDVLICGFGIGVFISLSVCGLIDSLICGPVDVCRLNCRLVEFVISRFFLICGFADLWICRLVDLCSCGIIDLWISGFRNRSIC